MLQKTTKCHINTVKANLTHQNCQNVSKIAIFDPKKRHFRQKMLVKSKLFDLETSFRAQNARKAMHFMTLEFTKIFFLQILGSGTS